MIRLIQDCEIRDLFNRGTQEGLSRYWYFRSYGSPYYTFQHDDSISWEEEDAYIEGFLHSSGLLIDRGKFDSAFPYFGMDEWTSIIGFVSDDDKAESIAKYIKANEMSPELITKQYPDIKLCAFYWIAEWWEAFGESEVLQVILNPELKLSLIHI